MDSIQIKRSLQKKIEHLRVEVAELLKPKEYELKKVDGEILKEFRHLFYMKGEVDWILHNPLPKPQPAWMDIPEKYIEAHRFVPNTVVDGGEVWMAEMLAHIYSADNATLSTPLLNGLQYIQVGTGTTAVAQTDYNLVTPISSANGGIKTTTATFTGTSGANSFKISGFYDLTDAYNPGNPNALTEGALFATDPSSVTLTVPSPSYQKTNRMFNRSVFPAINKTSGVQLTVQWNITIGSL